MPNQPPLKRPPYVYQLIGLVYDAGRGTHDKVLHESIDYAEMKDIFEAAVRAARADPDILRLGIYRVGYPGCWQSWERDFDPPTNPGSPPRIRVKGEER